MNDESDLQKEWRGMIITSLERLHVDIKSIENKLSSSVATTKDVEAIRLKIAEIELKVEELKQSYAEARERDFREIRQDYVSKEQFEPIRKALWGIASVIGATIVAALLKLIIFK